MRLRAAHTPGKLATRREFVQACVGAVALAASGALGGCAVSGASVRDASSSGASAGVSATASASGAASAGGPATASASGDASSGDSSASSPAGSFEQLSRTFFAFDTVVSVKASCSEETMDAVAGLCERFESLFSRTIETSDIGRVNAAAGATVEVAPETADVVTKALRYCEESGGLFDITIGAASSLWDFKEGVVPDPAALEEAVKHVDYRRVSVNGTTITLLDPQAKLDLGGIAKGYIADALCSYLVQAGCTSGFVNLGGNVKTIGVRPDGEPWHVGIQDPNDEHGTIVATVLSRGSSAVTSGLYERQFSRDGRAYWHILDPRTGWPVETDLVSATVFSEESIDGDGYTKPLFMMGRDQALAWMNAAEGIEGLVVGADGAIAQTGGCNAEVVQR